MPALPDDSLSETDEEKPNYFEAIKEGCRDQMSQQILLVSDFFILIIGVMGNTALLWLFLRERKSLCASKVLGLNLVVMDLIYLSIMPPTFVYDVQMAQSVSRNHSEIFSENSNATHPIAKANNIFMMFNLMGCPLLLTCMCIERYLAVIRPMLYMRLRKWEYRMAVSAAVWVVTLSCCLASGLVKDITIILIPVYFIISCLFLVMLACLGGVVRSLWQQSPAHTTYGNQGHSESPLKRRAVANVLAVVGPAVMAYLPVLVTFPVILYAFYWNNALDEVICSVFEYSLLFPKSGVFIGPLFYLSKARQMCCRR